eukprot:TRINITY_DN11754_c0_g1_i1.p1 TRINITY_DN11754_c0_g1~~TRINITY_DN11754_c0_g1_i1.p1  ORF type:complete len:203 (-),score=41.61 TRINITY_DN11754_c0_g1_i1:14-622(-)
MSQEFKKGDHVQWNSVQGEITGTVEKLLTEPMKIKSHQVTASEENPEYLVKSDKTGAEAAHKPEALTLLGGKETGKAKHSSGQKIKAAHGKEVSSKSDSEETTSKKSSPHKRGRPTSDNNDEPSKRLRGNGKKKAASDDESSKMTSNSRSRRTKKSKIAEKSKARRKKNSESDSGDSNDDSDAASDQSKATGRPEKAAKRKS